jgi:hypothetical protein
MEKRHSIRYKPSESRAIQLFYHDEQGMKLEVPALLVNESLKGMAVILVGDYFFPKQSFIYWKEDEKICSQWTVIRCKELDEGIYRLSLELCVAQSPLKDVPADLQ